MVVCIGIVERDRDHGREVPGVVWIDVGIGGTIEMMILHLTSRIVRVAVPVHHKGDGSTVEVGHVDGREHHRSGHVFCSPRPQRWVGVGRRWDHGWVIFPWHKAGLVHCARAWGFTKKALLWSSC